MSRKISKSWSLNFDEAFNMIYTGAIKDGKTIMLLQYAKIHNLLG